MKYIISVKRDDKNADVKNEESHLNQLIYLAFGLNDDEIKIIERNLP